MFRISDLHSRLEAAEILHLGAEDQVAELRKGQEDDEEHDGETGEILGAGGEGGGELSHGLVEADVFEHLDPCKEHHNGNRTVEDNLPVAEEVKVRVLLGLFEELVQEARHRQRPIHVERHTTHCYYND